MRSPQCLGSSSNSGKRHDPVHQVDEVDLGRVHVRVGIGQLDGDFLNFTHFISAYPPGPC